MTAGYFVSPALSRPAQAVTSWSLKPLIEHELKHLALSISRANCREAAWLCSGKYGAIYRSTNDGHWIWENVLFDPNASRPINPSDVPELSKRDFDYFRSSIQIFLRRAGIVSSCVVITSTPNSNIDWDDLSEDIGTRLGINVALPALSGLSTTDGTSLKQSQRRAMVCCSS